MDSIRIKIKKRDGKYTAYPEGLEDKISVEGSSRKEALAKAKAAIDSYIMAEEQKAEAARTAGEGPLSESTPPSRSSISRPSTIATA